MANQSLPPPETLRKLLKYDPETGHLTWRARTAEHFAATNRTQEHNANNWNARWAGQPALMSVNNQGYRRGPILSQYVQAHRAIWAIMTGAWPERQIDHINGNKTDNRWANLREVGHELNGRNAKRKSNNTSGINGVYWTEARQKWRAEITVSGRRIRLGSFDSLSEAAEARAMAEGRYGFTQTHGRRER